MPDQARSGSTSRRGLAERVLTRTGLKKRGVTRPTPVCPPGSRTGPPDFVGIGAMRAGTTRWFKLLGDHAGIAGSPAGKELHYFDRFYSRSPSEEEIVQYSEYFPRADGQIAGEWTPMYLSAPWVPPLLKRAAPQARLLVLLRDPVERFFSNIYMGERAAASESAHLHRTSLAALSRGFYHAQLSQLLLHFDRSQVLVQQFERCNADPHGELRRTLEFIGADPDTSYADVELHAHGGSRKGAHDAGAQAALVEAYRPDVERLAADFPEIDLALWPNFA